MSRICLAISTNPFLGRHPLYLVLAICLCLREMEYFALVMRAEAYPEGVSAKRQGSTIMMRLTLLA